MRTTPVSPLSNPAAAVVPLPLQEARKKVLVGGRMYPSRRLRRREEPTSLPRTGPGDHRYSMPPPSFHEWLRNRPEEVPDATRLALVVARAGAAGVTLDGLGKVLRLSSETLQDLLKALVTAGQVTVVKVNGEMVYRAAG